MKSIAAMAIAIVALALVPTSIASGSIEAPVLIACKNTGYQGTITTVVSGADVDGTGWNPYPKYYVYGSYSYTNINAWNYCIAGNQVGAISTSSAGSRSWSSCVTCASDAISTTNYLLA